LLDESFDTDQMLLALSPTVLLSKKVDNKATLAQAEDDDELIANLSTIELYGKQNASKLIENLEDSFEHSLVMDLDYDKSLSNSTAIEQIPQTNYSYE
jgi:hypothetical protein